MSQTAYVVRDAPHNGGEVHGVALTEHDAYAIVGRVAIEQGAGVSLEILPFEVASGPAGVELPVGPVVRPTWLDELSPGPLVADSQEIRTSDVQRYLGAMSGSGTSGAQDAELAAYLVALVNADRAPS